MATKPGRPERLFVLATTLMGLIALSCLAFGRLAGFPTLETIGFWASVVAVSLASLPLLAVIVILLWEKWRR
jgi:hypothetical protein